MTDRDDLFELIERRRVVFEQLLWQVPTASFAGQAFLLTIILRPDTSAVGRSFAAAFGTIAAVGVLVSWIKHRYTEELYSEWVNAHELRRGRPKLQPTAVLEQAFVDRPDDRFSWHGRPLRFVVRLSAFDVWLTLLLMFLMGDVTLLCMALVEVAGGGSLLS